MAFDGLELEYIINYANFFINVAIFAYEAIFVYELILLGKYR